MIILNYLQQPDFIPMNFMPIIKGERTFMIAEDIMVTLSDGYIIIIPRGTDTDLASVPAWAWSVLKPIDAGLIGDLIHDYLWIDKAGQIKHFDNNLFQARKFADEERYKWRMALAPKKKFKNWITHKFLRLFGGLYYSRQFRIPN